MKRQRPPAPRPIDGNISFVASEGDPVTMEYRAGDVFAIVQRLRAACNYMKLEISGARIPRSFTVTFRDYETGQETTAQGTYQNGVSVARIPAEVMRTRGQKCATFRDYHGATIAIMFFDVET